jgi:16S rRNA (cytosine1402-N4)-methyltransferase
MNLDRPAPSHVPVMVEEVIRALAVRPGGHYIDCTLGGGGHAAAILERSSPGGRLLGIDADPDAIEIARTKLEAYSDSSLLINDNFVNLQAICIKNDFFPVHGILFDLGLSSLQLDSNVRGFSFQTEGPLDMRFSPDQEVTAADIINTFSQVELARLIRTYGEEVYSQRIASHIVKERPITTTLQLARIIEQAVGGRRGRIHPATRTFQALRIAVNQELEYLESALKQAVSLLGFEGRLMVISYHSLEDRIVKQFMRQESRDCICPPGTPTCVCWHVRSLRLINKRVIAPSPLEIQLNPRSRSAKLRAAERIITPDEYCQTTDKLCLLAEVEAGGWRRPAILKRLQRTFSVAQIA